MSTALPTLVLSLHVLAATVWVGGQLVLAAFVPIVRSRAPDVLPALARRYARLAWPAFALLLLTGVYNLSRVDDPGGASGAKLVLVGVSGAGAFMHQRARRPLIKGPAAGLGLLAAVAAAVLGVVLGEHG